MPSRALQEWEAWEKYREVSFMDLGLRSRLEPVLFVPDGELQPHERYHHSFGCNKLPGKMFQEIWFEKAIVYGLLPCDHCGQKEYVTRCRVPPQVKAKNVRSPPSLLLPTPLPLSSSCPSLPPPFFFPPLSSLPAPKPGTLFFLPGPPHPPSPTKKKSPLPNPPLPPRPQKTPHPKSATHSPAPTHSAAHSLPRPSFHPHPRSSPFHTLHNLDLPHHLIVSHISSPRTHFSIPSPFAHTVFKCLQTISDLKKSQSSPSSPSVTVRILFFIYLSLSSNTLGTIFCLLLGTFATVKVYLSSVVHDPSILIVDFTIDRDPCSVYLRRPECLPLRILIVGRRLCAVFITAGKVFGHKENAQ
jgi:hypothetical protein